MISELIKKILGKDLKKLRISVLLAFLMTLFIGCELLSLFVLSGLIVGTNFSIEYPIFSFFFQGSKSELLTKVGIIFLISTLFRFIFHLSFYGYSYKLGSKLTSKAQTNLMTVFLNSPIDVFDKNNPGKIIHGLVEAPWGVTFTIDGISGLIINGFTVLLISLTLVFLSPWIFLSSIIIGIPAFVLVVRPLQSRLRLYKNSLVEQRTKTTELTTTMISSIRDIKSIYSENEKVNVFSERVRVGLSAFAKARFIKIFPGPFLQAIFQTAFAFAIIILSSTISVSNIDALLPQLAVLGFGMLRVYPAITNLSRSWLEIQNAIPDLEVINKWQELPYDNLSDGVEEFSSNILNKLIFSNINFKYDNEKMILSNLNFKIKKGSITSFVGGSGAGKSSIIDLIVKLRAPNSGEIIVNDQKLNDIVRNTWLKNLAIVRQDVYLFNDTIRENLKAWNHNASEKDMLKACLDAQILDLVKDLPKGLDTVVGDRGTTISGGQRQRIAIARALLRKPELLILDEALSALDGDVESKVIQSIKKHYSDKTILLVSHRLASLKESDWIIVLDRGKVAEEGTYENLIKNGVEFKKIFSSQMNSNIK